MSKNIGIDVGYGFVKSTDGEREFVFPSVVGLGQELRYRSELSVRNRPLDNLAITVDNKDYFVGDLAIRQSEIASRSLDPNRAEDRNVKVLMLAGLNLYTQWENETFNVVTGLPTSYFAAYRDAWVNNLRGSHVLKFRVNGQEKEKTITIEKLKVVPQPLGTLYDRALNQAGAIQDEDLASLSVGVVDVGFKTTDFAVADQLEFIDHLSGSTPIGLSNAYGLIAERLRQEFRIDKEQFEMDRIVERGEVRIAGKVYDISRTKREVFERIAHKIITELVSLWDYRNLDVIFFTGGGAQALAEWLLPEFRNAILADAPQSANARGFLKYANNIFRANMGEPGMRTSTNW
jgi:plasmid segregation protein ParM